MFSLSLPLYVMETSILDTQGLVPWDTKPSGFNPRMLGPQTFLCFYLPEVKSRVHSRWNPTGLYPFQLVTALSQNSKEEYANILYNTGLNISWQWIPYSKLISLQMPRYSRYGRRFKTGCRLRSPKSPTSITWGLGKWTDQLRGTLHITNSWLAS